MDSGLLEQISYEKAYRENRMNGALWVLDHPETFRELLDYVFNDKQDELSHKAAWVMEFVFLKQPPILFPHLDYFFESIPKVKKDQSVRPLANLCEKLCLDYYKKRNPELRKLLTEEHKLQMTEFCFDWMITDQKVACQARAMICLYYLGTEYDWIHPELEQIIERNIHTGSAGYKNRGGKILAKIRRS
ncbi:adenylosuccinate lyase [Aureisphaera galaxeae]|uniref:adenylosuccinate lyase n=1 Tax=Aureisphaera galaxeae TaxID=1538023 RepID=UPI0023504B7F|nr:adenylosuccinate lyase [Aureisphaera galaxeae]MDC8003700.1 adenylosuccinate lyase [Aureisphaera galaxeae]